MRVPARYDQNSLGADEPVELFKPELLPSRYTFTKLLILLSFNNFEGIFLCDFEDLLACLLGS